MCDSCLKDIIGIVNKMIFQWPEHPNLGSPSPSNPINLPTLLTMGSPRTSREISRTDSNTPISSTRSLYIWDVVPGFSRADFPLWNTTASLPHSVTTSPATSHPASDCTEVKDE